VYGVVYGDARRDSPGTETTETWVCRGVVGDDSLSVDRCAPVTEWLEAADSVASAPGSAIERDDRPPLTAFLTTLPSNAAAGLDFPFGLPERLVSENSWTGFLRDLPTWCSSPEELRWRCEKRVDLVDGTADTRLRATDAPLSALSPFDERIVASTFFGLRDVLRPLVLSDAVRVPPMTPPRPDAPLVLEVYPAGTLVDLGLFTGEGDDDGVGTTHRENPVDSLSEAVDCDLRVDEAVRERVDNEAPAFESLVAAYAVYRNTRRAASLRVSDSQRLVEGQVFV
jgi:hypothetical protein